MSGVLQPWVQALPWKMQSTMLSSLRGPDYMATTELKKFARWIRSVTQENADPTHTYMKGDSIPTIDHEALGEEIEYCTWHYLGHLIHALEIIAYRGPSDPRSRFAGYWYVNIVEYMHLRVESPEQMNERLQDKVGHQ